MMLNHKRLHKSRPYTHSRATCLPRQWVTSLSIFRSRQTQDQPWLYSCILYSYRSLNQPHDTHKVLLGRFPYRREFFVSSQPDCLHPARLRRILPRQQKPLLIHISSYCLMAYFQKNDRPYLHACKSSNCVA